MDDFIRLKRRWVIDGRIYESNVEINPRAMPRGERTRLRHYLNHIRSNFDLKVMLAISESQGESQATLFPRMIHEGGEFYRDVVDSGDTLEYLVQPKDWQENVTDMFVAVHEARTGYGRPTPQDDE